MISGVVDFFETIGDFLALGGGVLKVIFFTTFLLWVLILERIIFFKIRCPHILATRIARWNNRKDKKSWFAQKIRECEIGQINSELLQNVSFIKTLVALCPLLGLLGTVTGMIAVFDVMALSGTGDTRLMASGISMATIPTMAGMVAALSGLYFGNLFERKSRTIKIYAEENMTLS